MVTRRSSDETTFRLEGFDPARAEGWVRRLEDPGSLGYPDAPVSALARGPCATGKLEGGGV